jgi:hypothetical protein
MRRRSSTTDGRRCGEAVKRGQGYREEIGLEMVLKAKIRES